MLAGATRKVRCARCTFEWVPEASAGPAAEPAAAHLRTEARVERPPRLLTVRPPAAASAEREPPGVPYRRARAGPASGSMAALTISVIALAALVWGLYTWRGDVMQLWPPSQRLFAALGLQ